MFTISPAANREETGVRNPKRKIIKFLKDHERELNDEYIQKDVTGRDSRECLEA